jgi:aspartyl-tRNA(Asn)/glutamyl-tRNA(Gln) amidotransferase subunit B
MSQYIPIIGMEIHVELRTNSKMFCGCPADHFSKEPNTQTCPVCLGLPGALPVPNEKAVKWTQMIGLALNCSLATESKFDRKHYFYPDLSKGYQISQYDEPLCVNGKVGEVRITRVHLEEDTGKLQHKDLNGQKVSLVDFNRSGVALVEIVSEPDIHSAADAKAYAQEIRKIVSFLGVSDCDMEKGSMRLEANISLSKTKNLPPYKVEVKNINSFRFLEKAINYEIDRQTKLLEEGTIPDQETRGFNEAKMATVSQRSKEEAKDYRYFPEPDIPPMEFSQADLAKIKTSMPKLPAVFEAEFINTYKIRPDFAASLTEHKKLAQKALECFITKPDLASKIASFLINKKAEALELSVSQIVDKLSIVTKDTLSNDVLDKLVRESIAANSDLVEKFKAGKTSVIGAFVGDIMRRSKGQADPKTITPLILKALRD